MGRLCSVLDRDMGTVAKVAAESASAAARKARFCRVDLLVPEVVLSLHFDQCPFDGASLGLKKDSLGTALARLDGVPMPHKY